MQICFVCEGNTCRSPFAEKLFNKLLKQNKVEGFKICSCGINADINSNINENIIKILKNYKINVKSRKPKKLTKALINKTDLFITMTAYQKQFVPAKNVYSIAELVGGDDVCDPFGKDFNYYLYTTNCIEKHLYVLLNKILNIKESK